MRTGIALGSNIEPRQQYIEAAARCLQMLHRGPNSMLCSSIYETSPVDCPPDSNSFLNAVIEFKTDLDPAALLKRLKEIELNFGRPATYSKNDARPIDLDILFYDNISLRQNGLIIPHPQIAKRLFVLKPLSDVAPNLILSGYSKTVDELAREYQGDEIVQIFSDLII